MTNKKGFTMIELLGVIVILGILSVMAIVSVTRLITKSKTEQKNSQAKTLMMAAESYMQANKNNLPKTIGEVKKIPASELKNTNYLKNNLKNADGANCMEKSFVRVYKYSATNYSYVPFIYCGNETVPSEDKIDSPTIEITFEDEKDYTSSDSDYQNVKAIKVKIKIAGNTINSIDYPIMGYSYAISVEENNIGLSSEVFNSGALSGNGKQEITLEKSLTEYIDITKQNKVKVKVVARNTAGGYSEKSKTSDDASGESDSTVHDKTPPKCIDITINPEPSKWINASSKDVRKITATCSDGKGSGCIRERFNRTWPNDEQIEAEYAYIQVKDNAGNKNIEDNYIVDKNPCNPIFKKDTCRVKVYVDKKYPKIEISAHKRKSNGTPETDNMLSGGVKTYGGGTTKGDGTIGYKGYNSLNTNGWMNYENYRYGVIYKIKISDTLHLASWKWETNAPNIKDRNDKKFTTYRTGNVGENKSQTYSNPDMTKTNCGKLEDNIQVSFTEEGMRKGKLTLKDKSGNTTTLIIEAYIDKTKPTCEISISGTSGDHDWYKAKNVTVTMTKGDKGSSGLDKYGLTSSKTVTYNSKTKGSQADTKGITWHGYVIDKAGNTKTCNSDSFKVDTKSPKCTITKSGTQGNNGWYKEEDVSLTLNRSDTGDSDIYSGVFSYDLTNSKTASYSKKTTSIDQGNTSGITWYGYVKDAAGNTGSCNSGNFKVDKSSPSCWIDSYGYLCSTGGESARVACSENGPSGLNKCAGSSGSSSTKSGLKGNTTYTVTDRAGNSSNCTATVYATYQTRYRTRSSWCNSCAAAGCASYSAWKYTGSYAEVGGGNVTLETYKAECEIFGPPENDTYKCKEYSRSCISYYSSCSSCGTSYGSWGYFTGWSNYGCSETDVRDCDYRTLYSHGSC